MKQQFKGEFYLLLAALMWGVSFVFQKTGMDYVGPMTFGLMRFSLGSVVLLPFILLYDRYCISKGLDVMKFSNRELLKAGFYTSLTNFALSSLQQIGLVFTTAGKAGFISTMYIALVPILMIFLRHKVRRLTWLCIAFAIVGLYLLCASGPADQFLHLNIGDIIVLSSSVFSAIQIILIDHYADRVNPLKMAFIQFVISAVLSGFAAFTFETVSLDAIIDCRIPILYTGIFEIAAAYTLQIIGQQTASPVMASILMSLESVFAVFAGAIFLHEVMNGREITGCVIMFIALLLIQVSDAPRCPDDLSRDTISKKE